MRIVKIVIRDSENYGQESSKLLSGILNIVFGVIVETMVEDCQTCVARDDQYSYR